MKFGEVEDIQHVDFTLPPDHLDTANCLSQVREDSIRLKCRVGFAKWDPKYLQGLYPKGIGKNQLEYYSTHINCIEMNAFYYRIFPQEFVTRWYNRAGDNFTFCPKLPQVITQFRRLKNCAEETTRFISSVRHFKSKLGTCFIQMHPSFKPDKFEDLESFVDSWPVDLPFSLELRHTDWYNNENISNRLYSLLESNNVTNIITDTAGRRDLMHMRLTNDTAFIRFTGCNHVTDYARLDDWILRIQKWEKLGLKQLYFFIHQHDGHKSMDLYNHFITRLSAIGIELPQL